MELDSRKLRVLSAIVDTYLATGEPVGSKLVAELLGKEVSPATVRNDMTALFDMGYIEQPHTSAGRIPSHLGLRVYIDRLVRYRPLSMRERGEIDALFNLRDPDPDRLLEDAAQALADSTGCAAISTTFTPKSVVVQRVEIIPVSSHTLVMLIIASNGVIRNKVCRVDFTVTPRVVEFFQNFANGHLAGVSVSDITARYLSSAAVSLGEYSRALGGLLSALYELCKEINDGQYYQSGSSHLLDYCEMHPMAKELFALLDRRQDVISLVCGDTGGVQITIGKENANEELTGSTVIVSRYNIGSDNIGAIGIIGPVRLNYAKLVPRMEYFTQTLSKLLTDTFTE